LRNATRPQPKNCPPNTQTNADISLTARSAKQSPEKFVQGAMNLAHGITDQRSLLDEKIGFHR